MKVLLDTSVLIAAMVESHPEHARAFPWLQRIKGGEVTGVVSAHTLAEVYATITRLPVKPPISPSTVFHLIQENLLNHFQIVALSEKDYIALIEKLSKIGIFGGVTYDALILHAAFKADVVKRLFQKQAVVELEGVAVVEK
mgnify:CR=1 FL=1